MASRWLGTSIALVLLFGAGEAYADKIAVLPSRGSAAADPSAISTLDIELTRSLASLGHTLIAGPDVAAAIKAGVQDGVADTTEEYRAVAVATKADWVVVGTVEPGVISSRVEIAAYLNSLGRVESVAREIEKARAEDQEKEMLAVLVRPEGIGTAELPWEKQAVKVDPRTHQTTTVTPPPPPPPPPEGPAKNSVTMDYVFTTSDVWPSYSAGKRGFVSLAQGFSVAAVRPGAATGSGASLVGAIRGGYTLGDKGAEIFADFGGNLLGPPAIFIDAGARWMFTPSLHRMGDHYAAGSWFMGPEALLGAFVTLPTTVKTPDGRSFSGSASGRFLAGASLDMVFAATPSLALEASMGNLRVMPSSDGTLLLFGATLGASLRF